MAFDKTNPLHLQALKDEQSLDPAGVGYAAVDGYTQKTLDLFNLVSNNPTPSNGAAPLKADDLLHIIYAEAISSQDQFKLQLLYEATDGLKDDVSAFKEEVSLLSTALRTAIDARVRPMNRVEVLGQGLFSGLDANNVEQFVIISKSDWFAALNYTGD